MQNTRLGQYQLSQFMLGTVQFGLPYGVANTSGQPSFEAVCEMLQTAHQGGVNCLDTAPFYGQSEEVLGSALHSTGLKHEMTVVSKAFRDVDETATATEIEELAYREVLGSLQRLQLETLPICLVHYEKNFRHIEALAKLKAQGLIHHLGCSTTSVQGTREVIASGFCEAIQIPTNILDRRFSHATESEPAIFAEAQKRGIAVFVRSAYLQGLILMEPDAVPEDLRSVIPALHELRALAHENNLRLDELALRYVMGLQGLSCVVVGVESVEQVKGNLEIFHRGALDAALMEKLKSLTFDLPDLIFQPWRWQKRMPDSRQRMS